MHRSSVVIGAMLLMTACVGGGPTPSESPSGSAATAESPSPRLTSSQSVSPSAGTLIAYVAWDGQTPYLHTVEPDGQQDRTIGEGNDPTWSPDGRLLAYACNFTEAIARGGYADVCVANADGSGQRVLITDGLAPQWSPDGNYILINREPIDLGDAWVANADGTGLRHVVGYGPGTWSPNGQWVTVMSGSGVPIATVARPDGSIVAELGECWNATWSPDSSRVACSWNDVQTAIVVATGSRSTLLTATNVTDYAWVSSDLIAIGTSGTGIDLLVPATGLRSPLASIGLDGDILFPSTQFLSPDGVWLAFTLTTGESKDVYVVSLLDGSTVRLTTGGTSARPVWQPGVA